MKKHLYYDNPIDALYMVRNHGVKIENYTVEELREEIGLASSGGIYWIANPDIITDDLKLVQPQDGKQWWKNGANS